MTRPPLTYKPQLDGVRAVAIAVVLFAHFGPAGWTSNSHVSIGYLGVELFFVLSGFLITSILLHDREAIEAKALTSSRALQVFYARRSLRIFPTYYLALCFALVASLGVMKSNFVWFATYLTNVYIVLHGTPGSSTHLWSLAVEEQFYLVWPFVMLTARRPLIPIGAAFVAGLVFRYAETFAYGEYLLPSCIDYLAAGAALALVFRRYPELLERVYRWTILVAVFAVIAGVASKGPGRENWYRTAAAALSVCVVGHAAAGMSGVWGRVLGHRALRYVGRISYGLYLYHNFLPEGLRNAARFYRLQMSPSTRAVLALILTFVLAAASWHFIELPLQQWRRRRVTTS